MSSYCQEAEKNPIFKHHHDNIHGVPCDDDNLLFDYYCLEIAQAGLAWRTIMQKHQGMRLAFDLFDVATVANYGEKDIERLMQEKDVIKYRLKIESIIGNARKIIEFQQEYGSFAAWLQNHHQILLTQLTEKQTEIESKEELLLFAKKYWVKIFKKHFRFAGPEIVNEFLMGIAYLPDAHAETCEVGKKIREKHPRLPFDDLVGLMRG
ncbi:MAG: DNA-3-methyladenine glycosylase I [Alphaproteobacteria bacterium]|nr:DNA-3-methyladenine glycosylase I [Alphaproteobacteria bacterium]